MDRLLQRIWDRYPTRYSWIWYAIAFSAALPVYLFISLTIVVVEHSTQFVGAAAATVVTVVVVAYSVTLPGRGVMRQVERWVGGDEIDRSAVLEATYASARRTKVRSLLTIAVGAAILTGVVSAISGATGWRLVQYALMGCVTGVGSHLVGIHTLAEAPMRPIRIALAGDTGIGDELPHSRPSFATWTKLAMLASGLVFSMAGAALAAASGSTGRLPLAWVLIGFAMTLCFGVPITVGAAFAPSLQPIRDLAEGTERVAIGDYSRRLPVVQDDDLGALAASFNRMQAGLAERQRLQAAFGTYVDPGLAQRLLEQGDDVFTGERREVTVMFVDIRDFTPFAEANAAEDVVTRLNALFEIVVPAVVENGGHVNKFLGDGAMAVFGAPNDLENHADAAVAAAQRILGEVNQRFGDALRIGIGINTGKVIAGTIGGAGKLEFTLIGDAVNVAARVEQLTKTTGDAILLTQQTVDGMAGTTGLVDRGLHAVKGKSTAVQVYGLDPQ